MSSIYETLAPVLARIDDLLVIEARREGLPQCVLTGRIEMDHSSNRAWFEVLDQQSHTSSWVTPDAPELAAHGETLCAAASLDEAFELGMDDAPVIPDNPQDHKFRIVNGRNGKVVLETASWYEAADCQTSNNQQETAVGYDPCFSMWLVDNDGIATRIQSQL